MSYASRQSQSKAQTEANAKILRALVKQPENKVCADCKRNDPRWASWNIGCFLCIRCSGIHRSMGTHISKVKSIDLDIWTPEQMTSVQKWGNARANAYWEAHLKAGHSPPEHKVESFIRSKYESRRWAKEGPPPEDPSSLDADGGAAAAAAAPPPPTASSTAPRQPPAASRPSAPIDLLSDPSPAPPAVTSPTNGTPSKPSASASAPAPAPAPVAAPPKATGGGGGLFDLDWHEPAPSANTSTTSSLPGSARGKNDILSLYSSASAPPPQQPQQQPNSSSTAGLQGAFGSLNLSSPVSAAPPSISNPWGAPAPAPAPSSNAGGGNVWASAGSGAGTTGGNDLWGDLTSGTTQSAAAKPAGKDAFADIWGDFK